LEFLPAFVRPVAAFVLYFASGVTLTGLFLAIYLRLTPYAELALIRAGNRAAATSLAGAMLGYVIAGQCHVYSRCATCCPGAGRADRAGGLPLARWCFGTGQRRTRRGVGRHSAAMSVSAGTECGEHVVLT
jgi:hypothetical protein